MSGSAANTDGSVSSSSSSSSSEASGPRRSSRTPVPSADLLAGIASSEEKKEKDKKKEKEKEKVVEASKQEAGLPKQQPPSSSSSAAAARSRAKKNDSPPTSPKPGDADQTPPQSPRDNGEGKGERRPSASMETLNAILAALTDLRGATERSQRQAEAAQQDAAEVKLALVEMIAKDMVRHMDTKRGGGSASAPPLSPALLSLSKSHQLPSSLSSFNPLGRG